MKLGLAAVIAAALAVAGCGSDSKDDPTTAAQAPGSSGGQPAASGDPAAPAATPAGGTLVIDTVFALKSADPARNYEPTGNIVARALYDTLVTFKGADTTKVVPSLATKWEISPDGKTYTFNLDTKAVFSDGTDITSADVVFSLNRVANVKGNPSFLLEGATVEAKDADTVVIKLENADLAMLGKLASPSLGIVNSAKAKEAKASDAADAATSDQAEAAFNAASMGSGPYILSSFGLSTEVVFVPNDKYWGATKPGYSKIVLRNTDATQQKNNVVKGESQLALDLSPEQVEGVGGGVVSNSVPSQYTFYVFTNANPEVNKWTSNPDFQNAIRQSIDYDGLLELAGPGSRRAPGMVPIQFAGTLPDDKAIPRDLEAAKASLAKSGYDGSSIEISFPSDLTQNGVSFTDMATRIQANLKEAGINAELKGAPIVTVLELARGGKQQMGVWLWGPDFPDASNYLEFGPGGAVGGKRVNWKEGSSPEIEKVMAAARAETDEAKRVALFQEYQELLNQGPIISLIQPAQVFLASESLKGLEYNVVWTVNLGELS